MQIEGAKDPDEYVLKYGPERFQKCVDNAISLVEFKVKVLLKELNIENTNDKIKFLNEIAKILAKVLFPSPLAPVKPYFNWLNIRFILVNSLVPLGQENSKL